MQEVKKGFQLILDSLLNEYSARVPDVTRITQKMIENSIIFKTSDIENDHIAFRTIGIDKLGIQSLEKIFLHYGYIKRDFYKFDTKKLVAFWYSPPTPTLPRIFLSELCVTDLSKESQAIIYSYTDEVISDPVDQLDLNNPIEVSEFLQNPLWRLPSSTDYQQLLIESEYAAWVIYNRYYLNHYTISIHNLPVGFNTLISFNNFLENQGIKLNDAGGKIKISNDGQLLQSATVAQTIEAGFSDEVTLTIAGSYIEFAERKVLPAFNKLPKTQLNRSHFRDGFETANADKIFESTFTEQITR